MSYKTQTIFIHPVTLEGGPDKLLADLGYENPVRINDAPFTGAGHGSVWIGATSDCVIIYTPFAWNFFGGEDDDEFDTFKNALLRRFYDLEVTPLMLDGRTGAWGFAVFRHGALIRCQYGVDGETLSDEGEPLPFEKSFRARFERREADGETRYHDPRHPDADDMTEVDLSFDLVMEMFQSFTGRPFEEVPCTGVNFWLSKEEQEKYSRKLAATETWQDRTRSSDRPWWKFWG